MALPIWPFLLGGATSLFGGLLAKQSADTAQAGVNRQTALLERAQRYQMARQALLDPMFKEFLTRQLLRSRARPTIGGLRGTHAPFSALTTPVAGLPALPPPQLIGEEPVGSALAAPPIPLALRQPDAGGFR